jgi:hypothetical protein
MAARYAPDLLASFVRQAGARGIRVRSVDGDPHMVLTDEVPNMVKRVQAYAAYNAQVAPEARLAGIQFDVEPYLLPDAVLPPGAGEAGDLRLVDVDGRQVLVLLRAPVAAPEAQLYRLQSTREIDGSATPFHRDKAPLLRLLPQLEADFGTWDGFAGMAVHELR